MYTIVFYRIRYCLESISEDTFSFFSSRLHYPFQHWNGIPWIRRGTNTVIPEVYETRREILFADTFISRYWSIPLLFSGRQSYSTPQLHSLTINRLQKRFLIRFCNCACVPFQPYSDIEAFIESAKSESFSVPVNSPDTSKSMTFEIASGSKTLLAFLAVTLFFWTTRNIEPSGPSSSSAPGESFGSF